MDIWDLDGSTPEEHIYYADADGGRAYHAEDLVTRNSFDSLFNYIIDAGNPSTNQFWTKSIHTNVVNRKITQEVRISTKQGNLIKSDGSGIYIEQAWASWADFNEYYELSENAYNYMNYIMDVLYDDLMVITDDELLTQHINSLVNDELAGMRKVVNFATHINENKALCKGKIDDAVYELEAEFMDFSPYAWDNF